MAVSSKGGGPPRPLLWHRSRLAELVTAAEAVQPHCRYEALPDLVKTLRVVMLAGAENSDVPLEDALEAVREFEYKYDAPKKGKKECKTEQR